MSALPAIDANEAFSDYTVNEDLSVTINMHSGLIFENPGVIFRLL